jgi:hypothetical protein
MKSRLSLLLLPAALLSLACASGGGGTSSVFRTDIGNATAVDALTLSHRIISQYHYELETADSTPDIRMETRWRARRPFPDELALGINEAESRLIITGRQRSQSEMGAVYAINLVVENRVKVAGSSTWNEATHHTPQFREHANEIAQQFRRLVTDIGVRRF